MTATRSAEIVRLRWEEGLTLREIGERYGISRERVRQILVAEGRGGRLPPPISVQARRLFYAVAVAARHERIRQHGTFYRYARGCRCPDCTKANTDVCVATQRRAHPEWTNRKRWKYPEAG